jgi:quercetin dioxygenase-like cupin family protein
MIYKHILKLAAFAFISILTIGCNSETKTSDQTESDTADTTTNVAVRNFPSYDKSKSVTVISPALYNQLTDTLNIRMISGVYKPGDSSIMHAHPDFAMYVLEGGTVELTAEDGSRQNIEFKKDMAVIMPASTHSAKNVGKTTLKLVVVEVNRPRD